MKIRDKLQRTTYTKDRMKEAMLRANKKQIDISRETGIAKGTISNYLYGKYEPKPEAVAKIAKSLDVSDMWLMGYDVPMRRNKKLADYEDNPHELELHDYFETLETKEQKDIVEYVKAVSNGDKKAISPENLMLSEGEKILIDLFRRVPEEQQQLVLQMIRAALGNQG